MKKEVISANKENKTTKRNKILLSKFNFSQIILLLLIIFASMYYMFTEVLKFLNSRNNRNYIEVVDVSKQKNNLSTFESAPKNSSNFTLTNVVKVKNYYFLNGEDFVDFRSEKGNILYLELKEGIDQVKFNSLIFTTTPTEPIEVKLEKANFITITYTGEFKSGFKRNSLSIKDGPNEVYRVSYYNYSENMIPDKDYIPSFIPY